MEYSTESKKQDTNTVSSSLTYGLVLSVVTAVILARTGHVGWAWGFSVGAALSLISLFSLGILLPMLMMPQAPRASQFLLSLVLFMKLPLYAAALYWITRMPGVDARSAFPGILMAPLAITGSAVGSLVRQGIGDALRNRIIRRGGAWRRAGRSRSIAKPGVPEPAHEQG